MSFFSLFFLFLEKRKTGRKKDRISGTLYCSGLLIVNMDKFHLCVAENIAISATQVASTTSFADPLYPVDITAQLSVSLIGQADTMFRV